MMKKDGPREYFKALIKDREQGLILILLLVLFIVVLIFILLNTRNDFEAPHGFSLPEAMTMIAAATGSAEGNLPSAEPETRMATQTSYKSPTMRSATRSPSPRVPVSVITSTPNLPIGPTDTFPISNVTVRPTYTQKPTQTSYPTSRPTATRTATATASPGLPGLPMSAVLTTLIDDKGFSCAQAASGSTIKLWMCDYQEGYDLWFHVDLYGPSTGEVNNLVVAIFQVNPDEARTLDILGFMASLPYDGSNSAQARQWLAQIAEWAAAASWRWASRPSSRHRRAAAGRPRTRSPRTC